jgi:hypothetical protein
VAKLTIVFGVLLVLLGVGGYVASGMESWTAMIPAIVGIVLVILGAWGAAKPGIRMHMMHAAVMVGLLGFAGSVPGAIKLVRWAGGTEPARPGAVVAQTIMAVLMVAYVALCVKSFIAARKARKAGFPVESST